MADSWAGHWRSDRLFHRDVSSVRDARSRDLTSVRRPWTEAILLSASLSLLFILVYGGCNAQATHRSGLGTWCFAWELKIPFAPFLIVPYMSIDLFFVASFLLCADRIELRAHARRIVLAILIAGVVFLALPLTVGYPRPEVRGWTGQLFGFLWSFDKPHNLVPSLHVALASLLWPVYARHTRVPIRLFVHIWFTLIIASPIFTWQHHVLDVVSGAMLGQLCMFGFPEWREGERSGGRSPNRALVRSAAANLRVAGFYSTGSALLGILAVALGSWFWLLMWPAASLALIAIAYARGDSGVFRKANGRLPISTRVVLGPYLCGAFVRLLIYRGHSRRWVEAASKVYCGRLLTKREVLQAGATGITGVLDMTAEHSEARVFLELAHLDCQVEYFNVPVLDLTQSSPEQLDAAVGFIAKHASRGGVYVHCALGISRSVAAADAYIARYHKEALRRRRSSSEARLL